MALALRILRQLPLLIISPLLVVLTGVAMFIADLAASLLLRRRLPASSMPDTSAASVVIPNWNGRDLLEKYLPSVVEALTGNPRNEVVVVDNGSSDGSAEFLAERFPTVRVLALEKNLGFGGGSNYGFRHARNDIVVLLNSDMRVAPDFLAPLLQGFRDENVFAVSCQIFFSDPGKKREETGLTHFWWAQGGLRVRHVIDDEIVASFPCSYAGGGSSAFDRRKFLELGGFDRLFHPFYLEDTDLGFLAWKRGWKVLYAPCSKVWHEHRGTIGRNFSRTYVDDIVRKNLILFCWKNVHEPLRLLGHVAYLWAGSVLSILAGDSLERANLPAFWRAFLQLPQALKARWNARATASVTDREAFRRPLGGYFRDRFEVLERNPEVLNVLFLSPYPVCPPVHGGAVFMNQTLRRLGPLAAVHLVALVDEPWEIEAHDELKAFLRSMRFIVRLEGQPKGIGTLEPYAVREFRNLELEWLIHRQIYSEEIHVVQIEYTNMAQYAGDFRQIFQALFEHDVYFQSIARQLPSMPLVSRAKAFLEYLRALRYELGVLRRLDRIQTCTRENRDLLVSYLPELADRIDTHLRAGIETARYQFQPDARRPKTMLFLGSFRHTPNAVGIRWFLSEVMPRILSLEPDARLTVIGSDPPPVHTVPDYGGAVELRGFVEDIGSAMREHAVFVCPILAGSGLRVKLLEAFSCGIPVVSTHVGAEGIPQEHGSLCRLADDPDQFAQEVADLFNHPAEAVRMAKLARAYVERERDMAAMTRELELTYRKGLTSKGFAASEDRSSTAR